jgi:hypothetical protein
VNSKTTGYPTSHADGTNLTFLASTYKNYYNDTSVNTTRYYTVFNYNCTTGMWSRTGLDIPWGAIELNVYNESKPWQSIGFNLLVTNADHTKTKLYTDIIGPYIIDMSDIPYGENTIFQVSNISYKTRVYLEDVTPNNFYNFTFYLPFENATEGGEGLPPYPEPALYNIRVVEATYTDIPIADVLVTVERYINTTDAYIVISSLLTDQNGYVNLYLVPGVLYYVICTKDNYYPSTGNWIPQPPDIYGHTETKIFRMSHTAPINETNYVFIEEIHSSGYMDNITSILYVNYTDDLSGTIDCQVDIFDTNGTFVYTYSSTSLSIFQINTAANNTHDYIVYFYMNHTVFGYHHWMFFIRGYHKTITTMSKFNLLFTMNFGFNPFGWSNTIVWFILLGCFFSFNRRDSFMAMFMAGFFLLFLNYYIGFYTLSAIASGAGLPIIMIFFGILMLIRDRYRFGMDY